MLIAFFIFVLAGIFSGGAFIVPLLPLTGAVVFLNIALKASKSGSTQQLPDGKTVELGNMPFWKTNQFVFAVIFFLAFVGILVWQIYDK